MYVMYNDLQYYNVNFANSYTMRCDLYYCYYNNRVYYNKCYIYSLE